MIKIPAKIGIEMFIIQIFLVLLMFIPTQNPNEKWTVDGLMILIMVFLNYLLFTIKYYIQDGFLYIKNSFFGTQKIPIDGILEVRRTKNLLASPAASISGRIEIIFGNNSIIIAPKNYEDFKNLMLRINPKIVFK